MSKIKLHKPYMCITGGWFSSHNVGDNAIFDGICDSLGEISDINVAAFTSKPKVVEEAHQHYAIAPKKAPFRLLKVLWGAKALCFTGGTPFYDETFHMLYFALLTFFAKLFKVPVVIFGISIRTLNKPICKLLTKYICSNAIYIAGREKRTNDIISTLVPNKEINLLPDPASQMIPITVTEAEKILAENCASNQKLRVAICMRDFSSPKHFHSSHYSTTFNKKDVENYLDAICNVTEYLVKQKNAEVIFLPMNTKAPDDDRVPASKVHEKLSEETRKFVHLFNCQFSAPEMKGVISRMSMLIGTRFHSLVLASSMSVPTITIGYAPKNKAIMGFYNRAQYSYMIGNIDCNKLKKDINEVLDNRNTQHVELNKRNKEINDIYITQLNLIATKINICQKIIRN